MKQLVVVGACGRMGQQVIRVALEKGYRVIGVDAQDAQLNVPLVHDLSDIHETVDGLIDFSHPLALDSILSFALAHKTPCVLATTGYTEEQIQKIQAASREIAIFRSANMSVGVAVLRQLAQQAARMLGEDFDVEIVETHHRNKLDAPSGTALMLYDAVKDAYDTPHEAVFGRHGRDCKRQKQEIGVHALRGGTVAGEHSVHYFGTMERITLSHSAEDRAVFASGAVRAMTFLMDQKPGIYNMDDMLKL